jgi:Flp pilus assembly protein TadD
MACQSTREILPRPPQRRKLFLLAGVLALLGISGGLLTWRTQRWEAVPGSPYANTRPGVKYLGDDACIRCHTEIGETYRRHPMGRSLAPIELALTSGASPRTGRPDFVAQDLNYSIERVADRMIHREARQDSSGRVIAQNEAEIRYVLGSGKQAFSYLIDRGGFLFESPMTWYIREQRWGLSPGYRERNRHFNRPILSDCLFCHANRVQHVAGTVNRYESPIFQGHAIGCERCHGPGELHTRRTAVRDGVDLTIVNPADLEPSLRDAVCEQCHLIGRRRAVHAGLRSEDYRPGLPFYRFWSVFVTPAHLANNRFGGQVEQMHESRCYRASRGQLGCISCHDPHYQPNHDEKSAFFRDRCLQCHTEHGCRLPENRRLERTRSDDCTICHMPASETSNNPHLATTDHRIPRHDAGGGELPTSEARPRSLVRLLVNFHEDLLDDRGRTESDRDRGVALCRDGRDGASVALPLLEAALTARPDDLTAWESKAEALSQLGRHDEGLRAYLTVLAEDPQRETALAGAATLASRARRRQDSIAYWRQAIAVNPWRSDYHGDLARVQLLAGDWLGTIEASREALRLNPFDLEVRKCLVQALIKLGDHAHAREEFHTLLEFDPPDRDELVRRFHDQVTGP